MGKFFETKRRQALRIQELLPTDVPSVDDVLSWQILGSQACLPCESRLAKQAQSDHPALRTTGFHERTAYARLVGKAVDYYVLGSDAKSGLIGLCCSHKTGRMGLLTGLSSERSLGQWFVEQEQIETWSSDQGSYDEWIADQPRLNSQLADCQNAFRVDAVFTPRPISECAQLSHS
jgi:hypothetical protein